MRLVHQARVVDDCRFIQQATTSSAWTGTGEHHGRREVERKMKNEAAGVGGDTVLVQQRERSLHDQSLTADIYVCATEPLAEATPSDAD